MAAIFSPNSWSQELVINKVDADQIFSLTRPQWEEYVKLFEYPATWRFQLYPFETGTAVGAFDTTTGIGLQIQPLFDDDFSPPNFLAVGSWYPEGTLPVTKETYDASDYKKQIEDGARLDLGPTYSLFSVLQNAPPYEAITIWISRN
jgi:hypothetical protein